MHHLSLVLLIFILVLVIHLFCRTLQQIRRKMRPPTHMIMASLCSTQPPACAPRWILPRRLIRPQNLAARDPKGICPLTDPCPAPRHRQRPHALRRTRRRLVLPRRQPHRMGDNRAPEVDPAGPAGSSAADGSPTAAYEPGAAPGVLESDTPPGPASSPESGCLGTSRDSSSTTWLRRAALRTAHHAARRAARHAARHGRSSSTTSTTLRVWVPRHVVRVVTRLVIDYFTYAARPGASAHRAARHAARRRLLRAPRLHLAATLALL
jgi:hypothetical protein